MATEFRLSRKFLGVIALGALIVLLPACTSGKPAEGEGVSEGKPCRDYFVEVGDSVPELTLTTVEGAEQSLLALGKDKVILVDFWATWCAPCIAAMPHVESLHQKYKDQGLVVVGVMADGNAKKRAAKEIPKLGVTYSMLVDEDAETAGCSWGPLSGYPTMVMIGRDGKVAETWLGTIDVATVEEAVDSLFADGSGS